MEDYRKSSHTVYDIKYHLVWITKYRKPVLRADIALRARDLLREICKTNDVEIIKGHISKDHVHLFVSAPPHISVSQLVKSLKDIQEAHDGIQSLNRTFWGRHIWARGYFVASSGNVTDEVIMKYIEQQNVEPPDGDFKVEDEL